MFNSHCKPWHIRIARLESRALDIELSLSRQNLDAARWRRNGDYVRAEIATMQQQIAELTANVGPSPTHPAMRPEAV